MDTLYCTYYLNVLNQKHAPFHVLRYFFYIQLEIDSDSVLFPYKNNLRMAHNLLEQLILNYYFNKHEGRS